jgi:hypothetical protein
VQDHGSHMQASTPAPMSCLCLAAGRVVVPVAAPWGVPGGPGAPVMQHMHPVPVGGPAGNPAASGLTPHHSHPHGRGLHPHHSLGLRAGGAAGNGAGAAGANGPLGAVAGRNIPSSGATALLEEFKSNKGRKFEFSDLAGHLFEFCLDQHGSRFIQQVCSAAAMASKEKGVLHLAEVITQCHCSFLSHGLPALYARVQYMLMGCSVPTVSSGVD